MMTCQVRAPFKPYVRELFTPAGVNILRDSPADHKHHHGLMFAVAVNGTDFWSENENCGRQEIEVGRVRGTRPQHDPAHGVCDYVILWSTPQKEVVLVERRTIRAMRTGEPAATLLCWQAQLAAPHEKQPATLSGSTYFGLGMRFVPSMDTGGRFFNSDGKAGVEGTNDARSAWCAYAAAADGKPVTVAMFDSPKNARHPATWFTMDQGFAYLSATLNLSKEPLVIEPGKPLDLRYGVAVWDGHVEPATVEKLYRQWVEASTTRE